MILLKLVGIFGVYLSLHFELYVDTCRYIIIIIAILSQLTGAITAMVISYIIVDPQVDSSKPCWWCFLSVSDHPIPSIHVWNRIHMVLSHVNDGNALLMHLEILKTNVTSICTLGWTIRIWDDLPSRSQWENSLRHSSATSRPARPIQRCHFKPHFHGKLHVFLGGNRRMNHQAVLLTATQTASPLDPTPQNIMKLLSFAMIIK